MNMDSVVCELVANIVATQPLQFLFKSELHFGLLFYLLCLNHKAVQFVVDNTSSINCSDLLKKKSKKITKRKANTEEERKEKRKRII